MSSTTWGANQHPGMPNFENIASARIVPGADRLIVELERRKVGLVAYCQIKLDAADWHAVQDAASDIREIDAKLELLKDGK